MSMKPSRHTCTKNYTGRQVAPMRDGDATSCLVAGACFANKDAPKCIRTTPKKNPAEPFRPLSSIPNSITLDAEAVDTTSDFDGARNRSIQPGIHVRVLLPT